MTVGLLIHWQLRDFVESIGSGFGQRYRKVECTTIVATFIDLSQLIYDNYFGFLVTLLLPRLVDFQ